MPPKILLGLSDLTSLHLFFNLELGWPTVHGPVFESLARTDWSIKKISRFKQFLETRQFEQKYRIRPMNQVAQKLQRLVIPKLLGGNLTVLQSHLGTSLLNRMPSHGLFFEDTGERGYRIDRMLWQIRHTLWFHRTCCVLFGEFTNGLEPSGENFMLSALRRFAKDLEILNIPVFYGLPCGHGSGYGLLPLGQSAEILASNRGHFILVRWPQ